jgi:hypothetical protein
VFGQMSGQLLTDESRVSEGWITRRNFFHRDLEVLGGS